MENDLDLSRIGENIKHFRQQKNFTQLELSEKLGYKGQSSIQKIEAGASEAPLNILVKIAKVLDVPLYELIGINSNEPRTKIPVLGRVAAGIPIFAVSEIIDYTEIESNLLENDNYFGLKIKGDSMSPRIQNEDIVIVREQNTADEDDIVIALIGNEEGVCKKLHKTKEGITLISLNPSYDPMYFSNKEIKNLPVKILGKVTELRRTF